MFHRRLCTGLILVGCAGASVWGADMSVQLRTFDGSTRFSILSSTGAEVAWIDSLGRASFTSIQGFTLSGMITPLSLTAGTLPSNVIASSVSVGSVYDAAVVSVSASKLTGTIDSARLDSSSVTLLGSAANTANSVVKLDNLGRLPAVDASLVTGVSATTFSGAINPTQISAGVLPATVVVSSVAVGVVQDPSITGMDAAKLTGTIADARLDGSSVTLLGSAANVANGLVKLDGSGRLPAVDASQLTDVVSSALSGTVSPSQISSGTLGSSVVVSSVATGAVQDASIVGLSASKLTGTIANACLDASSVTLLGSVSNAANGLVKLDGSGRLPALDASQLTNVAATAFSGSIAPAQISSGTLPASVVVSSVGTGVVQDLSIVGLNATKLTGTIADARLDASSVTLLGNVSNAANGLVKLDGSGRLPAVDASQLTNITAATFSGTITPSQISSGALSSDVLVSSVAAGVVQDASIVGLSASKLTGTLSNARLDASSVTLLGNVFNAANGLVKLDGSGRLPAVDASQLTNVLATTFSGNVSPSQISAGLLGAGVVASSVAANAVQDASIVGLSATKLTGTIANARLDPSSVTLLGNVSNAANGLVKLDGSGRMPAVDGSQLTGLTASIFSGTVTPSQIGAGALPSNVVVSSVAAGAVQDNSVVGLSATKLTGTINNARLDASSVTLLGNASNVANGLVRLDGSARLPALDGSQLTSLPASAITGAVSPGQIGAGSLPSTVIASSVATNAVQDASIVGLSAAKLTGTIADARLDASSVTLAGNSFNTANGLTKLDSGGNLNLPSGGAITIGGLRGMMVPSGTIILTTSTCPSGFSEFTLARGFYLAGVPSGGTVGGSVGTAMTDLANPMHTHSVTATTTLLTLGLPVANVISGVNATTGGVDRGTVAPYFQIRLCVVP